MNPTPCPEETIFTAALTLPPAQRAAHVAAACAGDTALQRRVEALLRAHESAASLLQNSPGQAMRTASVRPQAEEQPGTLIDRYKLLQKIGEGGCGVVYMAEQEEPVRRRVALKVIKLGMDTKEVVARFEAERQALALMDHANIARVFDGGTTSTGRPYFVMELVRGVPITRYCDDNNLPTGRRLELFSAVCQAVQHAHQKGIIHRDLKPSNVLVTENDGVPVPKVIDFGIAKATQGRLTDATLFTAFEQFIGTPAYMSPEQAAMTSLDVDTRSDIYSLGVLLYELLTGRPPFEPQELVKAGFDEMRRRIREVEPLRPSARLSTLTEADRTTVAKLRGLAPADLSSALAGDLDWIVMRCLEKDRARRYESASALALDLQHYRDDQPVAARPPSKAYLLQKLVRRHRVACAAGAVILGALVLGLIATTWAYTNEKRSHLYAVEAARLQRLAGENSQKALIENARIREDSEINARAAAEATAKQTYLRPLLQDLLAGSRPDRARLQPVLDRLAAQLAQDKQAPAPARSEIGEMLGDAYAAAGALAEAESQYRLTLALYRDLLGEADHATARVLGKLTEVLRRQGRSADVSREEAAAGQARAEFLVSERWARMLRSRVREQTNAGDYAAAQTSLMEAIKITRRSLGEKYDPWSDSTQMAELKYTAGDHAGAAAWATEMVEIAKTNRRWALAGSFGWLHLTSFRVYPSPARCHAILGLVALRQGDPERAGKHLLALAYGLPRYFQLGDPLGRHELELATGLITAGKSPQVLEFLDRMDEHLVGTLESRGLQMGNFSMEWTQHYASAAAGRDLALRLQQWRADVAKAQVPADWQEALARPEERKPSILNRSDSFFARTRAAYRSLPVTSQSLAPYGFLLLGWCVTVTATRRAANWILPRIPSLWLAAFCLFTTADSVFFVGTLRSEGWTENFTLRYLITSLSWLCLWEFARTLQPSASTRRDNLLARGLMGTALLTCLGVEILTFMFKGERTQIVVMVGLFFLVIAMFVTALTIPITAGVRLLRWHTSANLTGWRLPIIWTCSTLLCLHGVSTLFLPGFCDDYGGTTARIALWIYALLPWLLLASFLRLDYHPRPVMAGAS
jgi:serine/threonine protein kinase